MIRTLFIIAGAALVLCIAALGGGIALGGHDLQREGWAWTFKDDNGENIRFERVKGGGTYDLGPLTTRTLAWTGGETLAVDSSIDVEYVQGDANSVVITELAPPWTYSTSMLESTSNMSRATPTRWSSPDPRPWPTGSS